MRNDVKAVLRLLDQRLDVLSTLLRGRKATDPFGFSLIDTHAQRAARDEFAFLRTILLSGSDHASWAVLAAIDERVRRFSFPGDDWGTAEVVACALRHLKTDASRSIAELRVEPAPQTAAREDVINVRVSRLEELFDRQCSRDTTHAEMERPRWRMSLVQRLLRSPGFWIAVVLSAIMLGGLCESAYQNRYELARALQRKLAAYVGEQPPPQNKAHPEAPETEGRDAKKARLAKRAK